MFDRLVQHLEWVGHVPHLARAPAEVPAAKKAVWEAGSSMASRHSTSSTRFCPLLCPPPMLQSATPSWHQYRKEAQGRLHVIKLWSSISTLCSFFLYGLPYIQNNREARHSERFPRVFYCYGVQECPFGKWVFWYGLLALQCWCPVVNNSLCEEWEISIGNAWWVLNVIRWEKTFRARRLLKTRAWLTSRSSASPNCGYKWGILSGE